MALGGREHGSEGMLFTTGILTRITGINLWTSGILQWISGIFARNIHFGTTKLNC
jgi:hypothetical protein